MTVILWIGMISTLLAMRMITFWENCCCNYCLIYCLPKVEMTVLDVNNMDQIIYLDQLKNEKKSVELKCQS